MGFSIVAGFKAKDGITPVFEQMTRTGNKFSSKTKGNFNSVSSSVDKLRGKINSFKNLLIGSVATYLSFETLKQIGGGIIQVTAQFEQFRISLETLLRSKEKGNKFFEDLKTFSTQTPFQMTDLVPASRQLLAFGVSSDLVINKMRKLSDLSMGDNQKFSQLVYAYGKTKTIGIASMRELREFTTAGVPIFDAIAKFKHITKETLLEMVKKRKINFEDIDSAITRLTGKSGQFYNMTYKQAHTLEGLWTTFQDVLRNMGDTLGNYNGHLKTMKGGLNYFIAHQKDILSGLLKISDAADKVFGGIAKVYKFFKDNWTLIPTIIGGVTSALITLKGLQIASVIIDWIQTSQTFIPILQAMKEGYWGAAFAQMALNTAQLASPTTWLCIGIGVLTAGIIWLCFNWKLVCKWAGIFWGWIKKNRDWLLLLMGPIGWLVKAGLELYDKWKPFHDLIDKIAHGLEKIFGIKSPEALQIEKAKSLKTLVSTKSTIVDKYIDVFINKNKPLSFENYATKHKILGPKTIAITKPRALDPKVIAVYKPTVSNTNSKNDKSTINVHITKDKDVKASVKSKMAQNHNLKLKGAYA